MFQYGEEKNSVELAIECPRIAVENVDIVDANLVTLVINETILSSEPPYKDNYLSMIPEIQASPSATGMIGMKRPISITSALLGKVSPR